MQVGGLLPQWRPGSRVADATNPDPVRPDSAMATLELPLTQDELASLARYASRRRLERSPRYRDVSRLLDRIIGDCEWDLTATSHRSSPRPVPVVAWNIERGKRFDAISGLLRTHPSLSQAELVLLTEVDIGMGRSGNRNVARELAAALGTSYVYVNGYVMLSPGDEGERGHQNQNTLSLHGTALLTRHPVTRIQGVALPEYYDKFHSVETRLGCKHALVCQVELPQGPTTVAVVHLDPFAPPRHRAAQLRRVTDAVGWFGNHRVLLGGDLNTSTYDMGSALGFATNILDKYLRFGFDGVLSQYMTPGEHYERRVFDVLRTAGLEVEGYNDTGLGTMRFDINDPMIASRTRAAVPEFMFRWLRRRLEPLGGVAPMRFDWLAGRGWSPARASVVERPRWNGELASDHDPICVELT